MLARRRCLALLRAGAALAPRWPCWSDAKGARGVMSPAAPEQTRGAAPAPALPDCATHIGAAPEATSEVTGPEGDGAVKRRYTDVRRSGEGYGVVIWNDL